MMKNHVITTASMERESFQIIILMISLNMDKLC